MNARSLELPWHQITMNCAKMCKSTGLSRPLGSQNQRFMGWRWWMLSPEPASTYECRSSNEMKQKQNLITWTNTQFLLFLHVLLRHSSHRKHFHDTLNIFQKGGMSHLVVVGPNKLKMVTNEGWLKNIEKVWNFLNWKPHVVFINLLLWIYLFNRNIMQLCLISVNDSSAWTENCSSANTD